jgi:hypothetical protein
MAIMRKAGVNQDQSSGTEALEFRIEGEINGAMRHGRRSLKFPDDGRMREWGLDGRVNSRGCGSGCKRET